MAEIKDAAEALHPGTQVADEETPVETTLGFNDAELTQALGEYANLGNTDVIPEEETDVEESEELPEVEVAEEPEPVEQQAEAPPEEVSDDPEIQKGWKAVIEQDRQNRQMQAEMKLEKQEMQHKMQLLEQKMNQKPEGYISAEELRKNPEAALGKHGIHFNELGQAILSNSGLETAPQTKGDPVMEERFKALEAQLKQSNEALAQYQAQNYTQSLHNQASQALQDEKYELLRAYGETGANVQTEAINHMTQHHEKTGEVLPIGTVLDTLQDAYRTHLQKLGSNVAVKKFLGVTGEEAPTPPAPKEAAPAQQPIDGDQARSAVPKTKPATWTPEQGPTYDSLSSEDQLRKAVDALGPDAFKAFLGE